jgi:hypothetical protein
MLGKREHCFWQTLLFSLPSFAALLWLVRGLMPLWPRATAAAAAAAILMQLACMYDPLHALSHHLTPVLIRRGVRRTRRPARTDPRPVVAPASRNDAALMKEIAKPARKRLPASG